MPPRPSSPDPARSDSPEAPELDRVEQEAFPRLDARLIARLGRHGHEEATEAGEVLFAEGDRDFDFFVVLDGTVDIVEHSDGTETRVTTHAAGEFSGDVDMLTGRASLVTARVCEPGRVLRITAEALRHVLSADPELSDVLLRGFLMRRRLLREGGFTGLKVIGPEADRDTFRLLELFSRNHVPHTWLEPDAESARALMAGLHLDAPRLPLVVHRNETVLENPSNEEMARHVGLDVAVRTSGIYDLVVVGAGPAGLAATVYAASEGLRTLSLEAVGAGGQAGTSSRIENYLGFPAGLSGTELAERAVIQALKFRAQIAVPVRARALEREDGCLCVHLQDGRQVRGRAVVLATGARYRKLALPRIEALEGRGIYYAATDLEARLCEGDTVVVVGAGNSAGQAATFLARRARRVLLVVRGEGLEASMSSYLVERLQAEPQVEIRLRSRVVGLEGGTEVEAVRIARVEDDPGAGPEVGGARGGPEERVECSALFVFVGADPFTRWLPASIARDRDGFVLTGKDATEAVAGTEVPSGSLLPLETTWPGVFAAGDVRHGSVKRVAAAVGEGSMVVQLVHQHLARG
ncbi:MAG TPA: FAD-dependent oxidoreductase [Thermoanaerobaculia bacterium]|nr:FAD-dependent oxidoreductase [Thermoanaerobaculia bacterium]